jgi:Tol biopolymer transport system component
MHRVLLYLGFLAGLLLTSCAQKSDTVTQLPLDRPMILNQTAIDNQNGIFIVDPTNRSQTLWQLPETTSKTGTLSWSRRSQRLLVGTTLLNPQGEPQPIKLPASGVPNPKYLLSPRGDLIAYQDAAQDKQKRYSEDLYVFDLKTGKSNRLTKMDKPGFIYPGAWAPDGAAIAFIFWDEQAKNKTLYVVNKDGTNLKTQIDPKQKQVIRLDWTGFKDNEIRWAPSGRFLAFLASEADRSTTRARHVHGLWLFDLSSRRLRELVSPPEVPGDGFNGFAWSPDSEQIALTAGYDGKEQVEWLAGKAKYTSSIYLINAENGARSRLTNEDQLGGSLFWVNPKKPSQ